MRAGYIQYMKHTPGERVSRKSEKMRVIGDAPDKLSQPAFLLDFAGMGGYHHPLYNLAR